MLSEGFGAWWRDFVNIKSMIHVMVCSLKCNQIEGHEICFAYRISRPPIALPIPWVPSSLEKKRHHVVMPLDRSCECNFHCNGVLGNLPQQWCPHLSS